MDERYEIKLLNSEGKVLKEWTVKEYELDYSDGIVVLNAETCGDKKITIIVSRYDNLIIEQRI